MTVVEDAALQAPIAHLRSRYAFCDVSTHTFRLVWLALLLIHGLCAYFYFASAIMYKRIPGSNTEMPLTGYHIGMPMDAYPTLAGTHTVFGVLHALLGVLMIFWSLSRRRCSLGPFQELAVKEAKAIANAISNRSDRTSNRSDGNQSLASSGERSQASRVDRPRASRAQMRRRSQQNWVGRSLMRCWARVLGRRGLLGVQGRFFDHYLMVREVIETALQVVQAYRMGQHLARPWLNRFYLAILVVNCWCGPLLHAMWHDNVMMRRALALACDLILNLLSATGVSALIMLSLYKDYDVETGGFSDSAWYDDKWFVQTVSELQVLLVTSWGDLIGRIVFSSGVLVCLQSIKDIVREAPTNTAKLSPTSVTAPIKKQAVRPAQGPAPTRTTTQRRSSRLFRYIESFRLVNSIWERRLLQLVHGCLVVTGVIVLGLHIHAESVPSIRQCAIQVHPWMIRMPSCVLVRLDCHSSSHAGEIARVAEEWSALDPTFVRRLLVTHCSALEMPPAVQGFSNLMGIKMYNTTIRRWEADAALTGTHHPNLVNFIFGRVNVTSKILPPGLMSPDFPPLLTDMSFAYSNLEALPDDVATSWPSNAGFACEVCNFKSIPQGLMKIPDLGWMAFSENPLTAFPFEMLSLPSLQLVLMTGIAFPTLEAPDPTVFASTSINELYLQATNVTFLPKWVDFYTSRPRELWFTAPLDLSGSPFCMAIGELRAGTRERLPDEWLRDVPVEQLSDFNSVRSDNVSALDGLIECASEWTIYYPKEDEDARYGLEESA